MNFSKLEIIVHPECPHLEMCFCRLLTQIFQPWLKLRRTVVIVLSSSWDFLEINLFVLERHGPMERPADVSLMLYQFTVANSVNQTRFAFHFGFYINKVGNCSDQGNETKLMSTSMNEQVKKIFEFLKNGFHDISSALDLSFEDDSVADEKIPFLAYLASVLKERSFFPYEPPAGSKRFRNLIADFLKKYHHIPFNADVSKFTPLINFLLMLYVIVAIIVILC